MIVCNCFVDIDTVDRNSVANIRIEGYKVNTYGPYRFIAIRPSAVLSIRSNPYLPGYHQCSVISTPVYIHHEIE